MKYVLRFRFDNGHSMTITKPTFDLKEARKLVLRINAEKPIVRKQMRAVPELDHFVCWKLLDLGEVACEKA